MMEIYSPDVFSLLRHPACPADWVKRAVTEGTTHMRQWVAGNPTLSTGFVLSLVQRGYFGFLIEGNPEAGRLIREVIPWLPAYQVIRLPELLMSDLVARAPDDESDQVRPNVNLIRQCVEQLTEWVAAVENDMTVRTISDRGRAERVLAIFSTSAVQVTHLCKSRSWLVREFAARNPLASEADKVMVGLMAPQLPVTY
jgi:hypothetical protein